METTEEDKQQSLDLKAQYKRNRCSERSLCLCLVPVFIYAWFMNLFSLITDEIFTQTLTDGITDYEFKGSVSGPSHDVYINFTDYTNSQTDSELISNERYFEVTCSPNHTYSGCYDNCKGECEFFKDWSKAGKIYLVGIIPFLCFNAIFFIMLICGRWVKKLILISILSFAFTAVTINYMITFIIWAIKMDLHENNAHHNVFKSRTAPVKRGIGLTVAIVFVSTMPFYLAYYFYIIKKLKVVINKGAHIKAQMMSVSQINTSQYIYQPVPNYIVSTEGTNQGLIYYSSPITVSNPLMEDYASPDRINISNSTSFNESLGK